MLKVINPHTQLQIFRVFSFHLKNAEISATISLDETEEKICNFIREAIHHMPNKPVARIAGGWVRDHLLGRPSKDIDITVEGMTGVEFANRLKQYAVSRYGVNQRIIGTIKDTEARPEQIKNLAVAFLRIYGQDIEILNLRGKEIYELGSRNPITLDMNATPQEDAYRRDLTINALFYNINTGKIEDFTGKGYEDLSTMTLRTPLDPIKTFQDDPLRVLRILRFHSRYPNSHIDPEVIEAMKDEDVQYQITRRLVAPEETGGIVPERTAEELRKIMIGQQPENAIRIMYQTGLLNKLLNLPDSFNPLHMDQRSKFHSLNVIEHTLKTLKNTNKLSQEFGLSSEERTFLNLAALFHDIGKLDPRSHITKPDGTIGYSGSGENAISHEKSSAEIWERVSEALKLSDKEKTVIHDIILGHMRPHAHFEEGQLVAKPATLRRYMRKNPLWKLQYIHAMADIISKHEEPDIHEKEPYQEVYRLMQSPEFYPSIQTKKPLVNGYRIMELVKADPKTGYIRYIQEKIRRLQDEDPSLTPQEAEQFIVQMKNNGELNQFFD